MGDTLDSQRKSGRSLLLKSCPIGIEKLAGQNDSVSVTIQRTFVFKELFVISWIEKLLSTEKEPLAHDSRVINTPRADSVREPESRRTEKHPEATLGHV